MMESGCTTCNLDCVRGQSPSPEALELIPRRSPAILDYDRYMKEFRVLLKNREQPAVVRVPLGGTLEQDDSATIIKDEKGNTVAAFRLPEVQGWYENRDATVDSLPPDEGFERVHG